MLAWEKSKGSTASASVCRGAAPRILQQPADAQVEEGQPLRLTVQAAGDGPLAFQWLRGGAPLLAECHAVLDARAVALADAGSYSCRVRLSWPLACMSASALPFMQD